MMALVLWRGRKQIRHHTKGSVALHLAPRSKIAGLSYIGHVTIPSNTSASVVAMSMVRREKRRGSHQRLRLRGCLVAISIPPHQSHLP